MRLKPTIVTLFVVVMQGCALAPGPHLTGKGSPDEPDRSDLSLPDMLRVHELGPATLGQATRISEVEPPQTLQQRAPDYDYVVGVGDVLNITVWDHPGLTIPQGSMRSPEEAGNWVHNDGTIFYPYVGNIEVAGLRVTQIRDLITREISRYIEDPQVDVTVAAFRSQRVYVTGAVRQPGTFPITNVPLRLLDAVNAAGGLNDMANWRDVTLTRDGREYQLSLRAINALGDTRHNVLLEAGDVVHVARNDDNKVFVLGEVVNPSPVMMGRNGLSLAEALATAGGLDKLAANASGIFVMRRAPEGAEHGIDLYQLNANNAAALVMADSMPLEPRDIVYVTTAPIARWNRVLQSILPSIQTLYFGTRLEEEWTEEDGD